MFRPSRGRFESNSVFVVGLRTTSLHDITHVVKYKDRQGPHALSLFGIEGLRTRAALNLSSQHSATRRSSDEQQKAPGKPGASCWVPLVD